MKKTFFRKFILFKITLCWLVVISGSAESANLSDKQLINMARDEGVVFLMRHALAPGMGDPQNFDLNDCKTQRLLSDAGRLQARMVGEKFRQSGLKSARVKSSQWCRCKETAKLLKLGLVEEIEFLNSFFDRPEREEPQTTALRKWLFEQVSTSGLILVTHQVNITALTGVFPSSGELVVIRLKKPSGIQVVGTIDTKY
tara:strand:- start:25 stop:621 length:597 start_codon:yes stop_codon:yes gene_type:complete